MSDESTEIVNEVPSEDAPFEPTAGLAPELIEEIRAIARREAALAKEEAKAEASRTTNAAITAREKKAKAAAQAQAQAQAKSAPKEDTTDKSEKEIVRILQNQIEELRRKDEEREQAIAYQRQRDSLFQTIKSMPEIDPYDAETVAELFEKRAQYLEGNWYVGDDDLKDGIKKFLQTPTGKKFRAPVEVKGGNVSSLGNQARNSNPTDPVSKAQKELSKKYGFHF